MQKELINLELKAMGQAVNIIPEVIKIISKFDGKVINKRFETALKQIDDNLRFKVQYNSFSIELWISDRHVTNAKGVTEYIKNNPINLVSTSQKSGYGDGVLTDDGRLISEQLIKAVEISREHWIDAAANITAQMKNIDGIITEHARIEKEREDFMNKTAFVIREYYGLNFRR